jgi:hypothetical protein
MNDDNNHIEINYEGEITFNDDETAIARISPRGYLNYRKNGERLLAGPNDNGVVQYELYDGDRSVDPKSEEGKQMLAKAIRGMINLGFDIDGRIDRLYRKGGYRALLEATDSLDGDYVKGRYFERILDVDSVPAGMVAEVIARVRERMGSDYDKGRLLTKVDTPYLKNDSVVVAYLEAVKSIGGDYEKSLALKNLLRWTVPVSRYVAVLDATRTLGGDYERSNVLTELIDQRLFEGAPFDSLLNVVSGVGGDYEKGNLLKQIIHKDIREGHSWVELIRATSQVSGDYDRSNLLVEIGQKLPKTDSLKAVYMTAAKTVHSDVDYGRVIRALD